MVNPPPQTVRRPYRIISNTDLADRVFRLVLEPVDPENRIPPFEAGQWVNLHILNPDGSLWKKSAFSISIAPEDAEQDHRVELGIKVFGEFTSRAKTLAPGDVVDLQGPFGMFTLKESPRAVFFGGGIGITPLRSMIRHAHDTHPDMDVTLFYSVRDISESAYGEEFERLAEEWDSFRLVTQSPCVTDPNEPNGFGGVDEAFLDGMIGNYADAEYYLCGPSAFMEKIKVFLANRGVDEKAVHQERFN